MKIKIKHILIAFLGLLLLASLAYKYYEWSLLKKISRTYNEKLTQKLTLIEQSNKLSNDTTYLFGELIINNEELSDEEYYQEIEEIRGKTRLLINGDEEYVQTLSRNKEVYSKLLNNSKILLGSRGKFVKHFLDNQIKYYNNEIKVAQRIMINDYLFLNILSEMKDIAILSSYANKTLINPEESFSYYFAEISVLEKYLRSDFVFQKEEDVKQLYPYGYEILEKNKEYMGSYYNVAKDYVAEDYEAAIYKQSRLNDAGLNLNIDFERLFDEGQEENIELAKKILETSFSKIKNIKDFKEESLGLYPLLDEITGWKEDLEMCQLYQYKFSLVNSISGSYPSATNLDELIKELSQIAPKSDEIDTRFDKNVIDFKNNDEEVEFICKDIENNKEFNYLIKK